MEYVQAYEVKRIPDRNRADHVIRAGGSVLDRIAAGFANFTQQLRQLAPTGGVTSTVRFTIDRNVEPKVDCSVHSILASDRREHLRSAVCLLLASPVARFYELDPCEPPELPFKESPAACLVVRKEELLAPSIAPEQNSHVPPHGYYVVKPFISRSDNDFLPLDWAWANTVGSSVIEVSLEPMSTSSVRAFYIEYAARVREVNFSYRRPESQNPIRPLSRHMSTRQNSGIHWPDSAPLESERDPVADVVLQQLDELSELIHSPHVLFNIRILASDKDDARALAGVVADSAFEDGQYAVWDYAAEHPFTSSTLKAVSDHRLVVPPTHTQFMNATEQAAYAPLVKMASMATHEEIGSAFRLPIGEPKPLIFFTLDTDPVAYDEGELIVIGQDRDAVDSNLSGQSFGYLKDVVPCHVCIFGQPGSGKTNSLMDTVIQLDAAGIPVLIIEPTKTEYRVLKALKNHQDPKLQSFGRRLRIYSPGNESLSQMRENANEITSGISQDETVDNLLSCYEAGMTVEGPIQALLPEILDEMYETSDREYGGPTMRDAKECARRVLRGKDYTGETQANIRAAMELRLGSLTRGVVGRTFQCPISIPSVEQLISHPTIIELDRLTVDKKCLFVLFLLTKILEYLQTHPQTESGARLTICIEEAHNIVGPDTDAAASEIAANPKAHAAEFISRMLAEFRARGVGIILADQSPHKVSDSVLAATATKIAFRLTAARDRDAVAEAMLLNDVQRDHLARLRVGEAYIFTQDYYYPRCVRARNVTKDLGLPERMSDRELRNIIEPEEWFREANQRRCEAESAELANALCVLQADCQEVFFSILALQERALAYVNSGTDRRGIRQARQDAQRLRSTLKWLLRDFRRTFYDRFLPTERDISLCDELTQAARAEIITVFNDRVKADADQFDKALTNLDAMLALTIEEAQR